MSPRLGYPEFSLPAWLDKPYLDGERFTGLPRAIDRMPSGGVHRLVTVNKRVILQFPYTGTEDPRLKNLFAWNVPGLRALEEALWYRLAEMASSGRTATFVDFGPAPEVFEAGGGQTSFTLSRPTAISQWGSFPSDTYPIKAFLHDGTSWTEQTVITSGSPSAGEVKVVGSTVTTPALTAGDLLEIRHVPAFTVVAVQSTPDGVNQFGAWDRSYRLEEVRS